jgi:hypothetical protein
MGIEIEKILMSVAAILGTLIAFKFKGIYHRVISIGLISVLLIWTSNSYFIAWSFITVSLLTVATFVYGLTGKQLNKLEKISVATMGMFLAVSSIFKFMHYPFAEQIKLSMIIPIIITLITFVRGRKLTREMSFMIFWLFYATFEFLRLWT